MNKIFYNYKYQGLTNSSSCRDGSQFNINKLIDSYFPSINECDISSDYYITNFLNKALTIYALLIRDYYNGEYLFEYTTVHESHQSLIILLNSLKYKIKSMQSIRDINECVSMIIYKFNKGVKDEINKNKK